ncbi:hypothetical protein HanXRQr2_Chr14g0667081 [Helianthus annuus]|uniref:Uncharacterized protein n=1 Tax=Helianthus annuus TaxID=4232 RepID=A0A9K3ECQ6_HELAN|nr:hypothetical protein HanXRQr2_Chr14g0667081 [Helianthus annuus]
MKIEISVGNLILFMEQRSRFPTIEKSTCQEQIKQRERSGKSEEPSNRS